MKILVAVCTRQRRLQLRECLSSFAAMTSVPGVELEVAVIENDDGEYSKAEVSTTSQTGDISVEYYLQREIGIPFARNMAIDIALGKSVDWLGFVDDDERIDPNWLSAMMEAAKRFDADVLTGPVAFTYETSRPHWYDGDLDTPRRTGDVLKTAATNNTLIRRSVFAPDGMAIRFREQMRFSGGEDSEYFYRVSDRGASIRWVADAVVYEKVIEPRLTKRSQLARQQRISANNVSIHRRRFGRWASIRRYLPKVALNTVKASILALAAALTLPASRKDSERLVYSALKALSASYGILQGVAGKTPQAYLQVDTVDR
ncbi:glycosyltransferase [Stappia sp. GBMRC 2046]|uniref:Glycosyltransferase n=1 Tax=Stappia sediminis TaxID=2692190 RepID=A0A7X3LVG8_9HYPH|nr:glycosyltransferase [Stappia sediminis]MXN65782.1 glycosyltransferase [Stappia sediminis]